MEKLSLDQKKQIIERVVVLDPAGEIVSLKPNDKFNGGQAVYSATSGVILGEKSFQLKDEEYIRSYLVVRLIRELRYPADCLELEAGYSIGHATTKKAQVDIKVVDKRKNSNAPSTFMLIETKRPDSWETHTSEIEGQLFEIGNKEYARGIKYAVWYSLEFAGEEMRDRCIVINFRKFQDHSNWINAGEPGFGFDVPVEYGIVTKHRYVKGKTELRRNVTRHELTRLSRDFHNQLWGGAKMGDTAVFNNLLKMFLAKIYDEQNTEEGVSYGFQIEERDGEPEDAAAVVRKINGLYQKALIQRLGYTEEQAKAAAIDTNQFAPNKVAYVVEQLEGLSIIENRFEDDVLGAFFESIIRTGFKQDKGQFFTHTNIARFMLYALELDTLTVDLINGPKPRLPYIIDPSCGSGTFILEAMKMVTQTVLHTRKTELKQTGVVRSFINSHFHPQAEIKNEHNQWAGDYIYGVDGSEDLAAATKVNMIMHGDGSANIMKADGLAAFDRYLPGNLQSASIDKNGPYPFPVNGQFDVIIANPPFSLKEDARTLDEYGKRFLYGGTKNSENLFIERWYQLLREGGRMGVVLPDSVFDTNENLYIRVFLYRFFHINAVVSLPQVTFQPYTPTKTSLLFAQKKTRDEVESWDAAWRSAGNEYGKLRNSSVIKGVLQNDRVRNGLIKLASDADVEWYPARNLLDADTLAEGIRERLTEAAAEKPTLAKRLDGLLAEYDEIVSVGALAALAAAAASAARSVLTRLLRDRVPPLADSLSLTEFVEAAYDDLVDASKLNWSDSAASPPYTNAWWLFSEVTSQPAHDYDIFFAEAQHVGYKRTTRHPEGLPQPNDLLQLDSAGDVLLNVEEVKTILDRLRSKKRFFASAVTLDEAAKVRVYHRRLSDVSASLFLRLSARYLHPRFHLLKHEIIASRPAFDLGAVIARPIKTGVQPSYAEQGVAVVKIATMRNGHFDWSDTQFTTEDFYAAHQRRAGLARDDILVSSTGTGSLGKIDRWDSDEPALATVDINIVRLRPHAFDPLVLTHVLRNRVVQWQIEQELTGATNQIHIYGNQLASLRLPLLRVCIESSRLCRR